MALAPSKLSDLSEYSQYGPLKADAAAAVIELLTPIQTRYRALSSDPAETARLLGLGAAKARGTAAGVMARAREAIGLVTPA